MRSRWDFNIDCKGVRFNGVHNYDAQITKKDAQDFGLPPFAFNARISIVPDEQSRNPLVEQTGKLKITIPGNNEQTKDLAYWLAKYVAQRVTFEQGEVKINYGLVMGEHLPDSADEERQLDGKPWFATVQLVQYPPTPTFDDPTTLTVSNSPLIQQFNDADSASNSIDRYLGLFKILEDIYGPISRKANLADALKASAELSSFAKQYLHVAEKGSDRPLNETDYLQLIDKLVKSRHECAHLRSQKDFGLTHGHPRVTVDIEPLIGPLRQLAFQAIQKRL